VITNKKRKGHSLSCSIVIRCFNEEKHIGRLLHGIEQQTVRAVQIIVVDSGSTDATLSIVSRYPVKLISIKPEEFSFGRSLNLGCASANTEFIVLASAHVYPLYKDWLEQLLTPFMSSEIGLVYGKQVGGNKTRISEHRIFSQWFPEAQTNVQKHPFCNNANAAIPRTMWSKYPYDEELTGLEDIAWANQAMNNGFRIAYQPGAVVAHIHEESYFQVYNRYRREAIAFKRIFPAETFTGIDFLRLFISNTLSDYRHAMQQGKFLSSWRDITHFRLSQFKGTYLGFRDSGRITDQIKHRLYYPENKLKPNAWTPLSQDQESLRIDYESNSREFRGND
jgi:glycosyltransferase involved in cell wall biosynthesis